MLPMTVLDERRLPSSGNGCFRTGPKQTCLAQHSTYRLQALTALSMSLDIFEEGEQDSQ